MIEGRTPPHSLEAEQAVLGAAMISNEALGTVFGGDDQIPCRGLLRDDFYMEAHRCIYDAISCLHDAGSAVDTLTVHNALSASGDLGKIGGVAYILTLSDAVPTAAHVGHYMSKVVDCSQRRKVIVAAQNAAVKACDQEEDIQTVIRQCGESMDVAILGTGKTEDAAQWALGAMEWVMYGSKTGRGMTGIKAVDDVLKLPEQEALIIVGARPSTGKTAMGLEMAINAAKRGTPTVVYSLEMPKTQMGVRLLANLSATDLRPGDNGPTEEQVARMSEAYEMASELPLWCEDRSDMSVAALRAHATMMHRRHQIGLVVIDQLQQIAGVMSTKGDELRLAYAATCRALKTLARQLQIPIVLQAQLNRSVTTRESKRPVLTDLRESGAQEEVADVVMLLHCDGAKPGCVDFEVIIAKNRISGGVGAVKMMFDKPTQRLLPKDSRYETQAPEDAGNPGSIGKYFKEGRF